MEMLEEQMLECQVKRKNFSYVVSRMEMFSKIFVKLYERATDHMNELFLQWAKEHTQELRERGITSEIMDHTEEIREKHLQNPCQVVNYDTPTHVGCVGVWKTGCMDIEILSVETEELEYYQHYDTIEGLFFDDLVKEFFQKMG